MANKKGCRKGYYWNGEECKPYRGKELSAGAILAGIVGTIIGGVRANKNQAQLDSEMEKEGPQHGPKKQEPKEKPKLKKGGSVMKGKRLRNPKGSRRSL